MCHCKTPTFGGQKNSGFLVKKFFWPTKFAWRKKNVGQTFFWLKQFSWLQFFVGKKHFRQTIFSINIFFGQHNFLQKKNGETRGETGETG